VVYVAPRYPLHNETGGKQKMKIAALAAVAIVMVMHRLKFLPSYILR
jgi:hypothetical protein